MLNTFCKLFNIVFDSSVIPVTWTEGIICPIDKIDGDLEFLTIIEALPYSVVLVNFLPLFLTTD